MYKFNFLNKINQEKILVKKAQRLVGFIFMSVIVALIVLLGFGYLQIANFENQFEKIPNEIIAEEAKLKRIRNDEFVPNSKIRKLYEFQTKRLSFLDLYTGIASFLDSNTIVDKMNYGDDKLSVTFKSKTALDKSDLLIKITSYKDSLVACESINKYLDKESISLVSGPEIDGVNEEREKNIWYYVLEFDLKPMVRKKGSANMRRKRKSRFN